MPRAAAISKDGLTRIGMGRVFRIFKERFPVPLAAFGVCAALFLHVPDLDLWAMPLLHHRSILTHSILPAVLLLAFGGRFGAAAMAGALLGLGVHLACDGLSRMAGFGQVWLPAPFKMPLGGFSRVWLFGNALVGFVWAFGMARRAFGNRFARPLVIGAGTVAALVYGVAYERTLLAGPVAFLVLVLAVEIEGRSGWRRS